MTLIFLSIPLVLYVVYRHSSPDSKEVIDEITEAITNSAILPLFKLVAIFLGFTMLSSIFSCFLGGGFIQISAAGLAMTLFYYVFLNEEEDDSKYN